MARQAFAATPRSQVPAARLAAHLGERRLFRPTPELFAGLAILALSFNNFFGFYAVLLFFASTAAVVALRPLPTANALVRFFPLLLLPVLAILSTIWSDSPQRTMRAGLQLFATAAAAVVICRNLSVERLVLALFAAFLALNLMLLPYIPPALAAKTALVAWLGSKNQVGTVAYLLIALSLAMLFDRRQPRIARLAAIGATPFALFVAGLSQSGGTTSSIVLTLLVFPPLALLAALKPPLRVVAVLLALCLFALAVFFLDDIEAMIADFRQNVLKKDATLTGRTYLWEFADRLSAARPVLGYGYGAFWRQGNIDAEGLWRWGGVANRSGFNFHNVFIGMRVDLGMAGLALLVITCVGVAVAGLARQIARPSVAMACVIAMTAVNYARSFVEEGLVAPFSLATVTWLATALYAFALPAPAAAPVARGRDSERPRQREGSGDRSPRRAGRGPARGVD